MIEFNALSAGYSPQKDILRDLSSALKAGVPACIIGPNGCGKTSLLKVLAGRLAYRGSVKLQGRELRDYKEREIAAKMAVLAQVSSSYFAYTVEQTVMMGRYRMQSARLFSAGLTAKDKRVVFDCMEKTAVLDLKKQLITELSGGQLQRVFLARTLAQEPDIILLDEPTNHLDLHYQLSLIEYLREWGRQKDKLVLGVLHDLNLARSFASHCILMSQGRIAAQGKAEDVFMSEQLDHVFRMDVQKFMQDSFASWRRSGDCPS